MCGLFFCENIDNQILNLSTLRSHLRQRGRDEYNELEYVGNLFIHSRLSINALNENGSQPYNGRKLVILFNGEIYNYHELVIQHDLNIGSNQNYSECCVIEAIIERYGVQKGASLFRGMFAVIIYDKSSGSITFFRDQFGIKPLFFRSSNEGIQISSLASLLKVSDECISKNSLTHFLNYGSVSSLEPVYQNVICVQPGYIYTHTNNYVTYSKYGEGFNYNKKCTNKLTQLEKILADEIILNSVSDVKCGILLSGGVDSALLASLWQKYVKKPLIAYNLSFTNSVVDESERAKDIANKLNLQYKIITIDETRLEGYFTEFISVMDQPSIDGFNTYLITKSIDDDIKVLLSGAGADELFLGYDFYKHIVVRPKVRKILTGLMRKIHSLRPNRFTEKYILVLGHRIII